MGQCAIQLFNADEVSQILAQRIGDHDRTCRVHAEEMSSRTGPVPYQKKKNGVMLSSSAPGSICGSALFTSTGSPFFCSSWKDPAAEIGAEGGGGAWVLSQEMVACLRMTPGLEEARAAAWSPGEEECVRVGELRGLASRERTLSTAISFWLRLIATI